MCTNLVSTPSQGLFLASKQQNRTLRSLNTESRHIPVLRDAVVRVLAPHSGDRVLDCTLGLGGHSDAFLAAVSPDGTLVALDADTANMADAQARLATYGNRVTFVHANFSHVASLALGTFDVVFADLGLSSPHLDDPGRGFSFRTDGPLDLRYDQTSGVSATEFIERSSEDELVTIIHEYGELHQHVRPLARLLAGQRIDTTFALKAKVESVFSYRTASVLPRIFQALRIAVNDELGALTSLLDAMPALIRPGGRAGILSYHSLEDRLVKRAFKAMCEPEKDPLTGRAVTEASFESLVKKPIAPDDEELASNPRSRSVKFRAIHRI